MNTVRQQSPDPGRTAFTSHPGFRAGRWLLAVPAHLTMVGSVLAVAFAVAPTAPVAESSAVPPEAVAATPAPIPSPSHSRVEDTVVTDSPADEWLPPEESFHCQYVATQIAVKAEYGLQVTSAEKAVMADVLSACPGQELPTDHRNEDLN